MSAYSLVAPPCIPGLFVAEEGRRAYGVREERGPITIALVEDNAPVRAVVRGLLEAELDFAVVGEADAVENGVELVARLKPDVLVLDLTLGTSSGLEVARRVAALSPATRVVVLTVHQELAYVARALEAGAAGYMVKGWAAEQLPRAVREVRAGRLFLGPPSSADELGEYQRKMRGVSL